MAGCCDCGNETTGSIKGGVFLDQLRTCRLLRDDSFPWRYNNKCKLTTVPRTKSDVIIRDNEKETCMLGDDAISGDKCHQERSREFSKI